MSKKEIIYILINIPLCFIFFYLFSFSLAWLNKWEMYGLESKYLIIFFIISVALNAFILKALKILTSASLLLSLFEILIFYCLTWHYIQNNTF